MRVQADPQAGGTVEVRGAGTLLGTGTLSNGRATVRLGDTALAAGTHTLEVVYLGSDTVAGSQTTVDVRVVKTVSQVRAEVTSPEVVVNRTRSRVRVNVAAEGLQPDGPVILRSGGRVLGEAVVQNGTVVLRLDTFSTVGVKTVSVRYLGDDNVRSSSSTFRVRVVRR